MSVGMMQLFGGIIPTDIQGAYRSGVPTVTTAVTNDYYHTPMDTPDKVDLQLLADSSDCFDLAVDFISNNEPEAFTVDDPKLWVADVTTANGAMFTVDAMFHDGAGAMPPGATATASILFDDFSLAATGNTVTDTAGRAHFEFSPAALSMGSGNRYLHVTAGPTYPLVEKILKLP